MKLQRVLIMLFCALTSLLLISSTVGVAWGKIVSDGDTKFIGLWKSCDKNFCLKYNERTVDGAWYAIRMNMVMALMMSFSGFLLSFAMILNDGLNSCYLVTMYSLSGLLSATALFMWRDRIIPPYQVGYSYALGWVGFVMALLVILGCVVEQIQHFRQKKKSEDTNEDCHQLRS